MMPDNRPITERLSSQVLFGRNDFILVAAALALLAGFLLPVPAQLLDVLWVLSLCFGAALLLISIWAKEAAELASFPALLAVASVLRIALNVTSARLIFLRGIGGTVIKTIGQPIATSNPVWTIMVALLCAAVVVILVYIAARRITKASLKFALEIVPLKRIGIETDLNSGFISDREAEQLKDKVLQETRFYSDMAGVTKLMLCDVAIAASAVVITVAGQTAMSAINRMTPDVGVLVQSGAGLAAGAAVLALVPVVIMALGSAYLVGKSSLSLSRDNSENQQYPSETIKIVSSKTGQTEEVELLNPDFAQVADSRETPAKVAEDIASFEPVAGAETGDRQPKVIGGAEKFGSMEDYYNDIAARIGNLPIERKPVLFAAESTELLPVTVAVNAAIRITKNNQRCLLIDADVDRNAIAKVFERRPEQIQDKPTDTCIKNLAIWSVKDLLRQDSRSPRETVKTIAGQYDRVIIYAPNINSSAGSEILFDVAADAIVFTAEDGDDDGLCRLLKKSQCQLLAIILSAESAVRKASSI